MINRLRIIHVALSSVPILYVGLILWLIFICVLMIRWLYLEYERGSLAETVNESALIPATMALSSIVVYVICRYIAKHRSGLSDTTHKKL